MWGLPGTSPSASVHMHSNILSRNNKEKIQVSLRTNAIPNVRP